MRIIYLTGLRGKSKKVLVDSRDYKWISQFSWNYQSAGYAIHSPNTLMHRLIIDAPKGKDVDHINGNKLDNRRENLRICDRAFNNVNSGLRRDNKSGFKGVSWSKDKHKWTVRIHHDGHYLFLGYFVDPKKAAEAFMDRSREYYGEFVKEGM